jgi:hypothetical protein
MDYFNIGSSLDLIEHNENHATLFYTSTIEQSGVNYTNINTVDILRFPQDNISTLYRTSTVIHNFRDRSNDSADLGKIGLSIYNYTILLT